MKHIVSHKGCTIIFDDHTEYCAGCEKTERRDRLISRYLRGVAKLVYAVNVNNDWIEFAQEMQNVALKLRDLDDHR